MGKEPVAENSGTFSLQFRFKFIEVWGLDIHRRAGEVRGGIGLLRAALLVGPGGLRGRGNEGQGALALDPASAVKEGEEEEQPNGLIVKRRGREGVPIQGSLQPVGLGNVLV
jgi:hypothetical protein